MLTPECDYGLFQLNKSYISSGENLNIVNFEKWTWIAFAK